MLVRLGSKSCNGWSAIDAFGGGGGEEREEREVFLKMVFFYCRSGGKEEKEQCRSKRHRSVFFLCVCVYETTSFWIKRAVSFKKKGARICFCESVLNHL